MRTTEEIEGNPTLSRISKMADRAESFTMELWDMYDAESLGPATCDESPDKFLLASDRAMKLVEALEAIEFGA